MNKMVFSTVAALCLAAFSSYGASAKSKIFVFADYAQLTYNKTDASYSKVPSASGTFVVNAADVDEKKNSFTVGVGYNMSPQLAVFGGYGDFSKYSATGKLTQTSGKVWDVTYTSENTGLIGGAMIDINVGKSMKLSGIVGMAYTTEKFSVTGTSGSESVTFSDATENNNQIFFGGGASYIMKGGMEVYGFWRRYKFAVTEGDAIGGGIKFAFK